MKNIYSGRFKIKLKILINFLFNKLWCKFKALSFEFPFFIPSSTEEKKTQKTVRNVVLFLQGLFTNFKYKLEKIFSKLKTFFSKRKKQFIS